LTPAWDDLIYVTATVVDENGIIVPSAADAVTFSLTGPGRIIAVDNGDNASTESFRGNQRRAFQGRCVAMVKASADSGTIEIAASAEGLAGAAVSISAAAPQERP